jgi:shikimate dehydrogenase
MMTLLDRYAVFGNPIQHSLSPTIHTLFAQQTAQTLTYTAQQVTAENFTHAVKDFFAHGGQGLNCTVPLKELAFAQADILTERAQLAKAVNTLARQTNGQILGDNTDGVGLVTDLTLNHQLVLARLRVLILGAGGATRGILAPLIALAPASLTIANRSVDKALQLAQEFNHLACPVVGCGFDDLKNQRFDLILNATSASLTEQLPPLAAGVLVAGGWCYDLAYSRQPTTFMRWGWENQAAKSVDGLGMLVEQAAEAFYIWRGIRPRTAEVLGLLINMLK